MNDQDYDAGKSERATRMVNDALEEMHRRRSEYRRARRMDSVTRNMQASFQSAVVDVYDEIYPYRKKVKDQWDEFKLDQIHHLDNRRIETQDCQTAGGKIKVSTGTEPYRIPCNQLLTWSKCLDDVARDLGFSAPFDVDTAELHEAEV